MAKAGLVPKVGQCPGIFIWPQRRDTGTLRRLSVFFLEEGGRLGPKCLLLSNFRVGDVRVDPRIVGSFPLDECIALFVSREPSVKSCLTDTIPSHPLNLEFLRRRIPCFKRVLQLLLAAWLTTGTLWAASDPFVGKWKLDTSQSKETEQMKIEAAGPNSYVFDFGGGGTETLWWTGPNSPATQEPPCRLPPSSPILGICPQEGRVHSNDGHLQLSADAKTLTDNFTASRPDGWTFSIDYVFTRTAGSSGFAGRWESSNEKLNSVYELEIQPYQGDGLALLLPAEHSARKMKFDGKDYPVQGDEVAPGSASSGQRVNDHTLEITDKINGRTTDTQRITLSPDLNTLTMTVQQAGHSKPDALVFNRE